MKFRKLLAGVLSVAMVATMIPASLGTFVSAEGDDLSSKLVFQYTDSLIDRSGNGNDGTAVGTAVTTGVTYDGKSSVYLGSTTNGGGSIKLPSTITSGLDATTGFTFTTWINLQTEQEWTRILDLGTAENATTSPYLFINGKSKTVIKNNADTEFYNTGDAGYTTVNEWHHLAFTFLPNGSSIGMIAYLDGEVFLDYTISQTSSGTYGPIEDWMNDYFSTMADNYIGHSRYADDPDLNAYLSDMRFYGTSLSAAEVTTVMCAGLTDAEVLALADDALTLSQTVTSEDIALPTTALNGLVAVTWASSNEDVLSAAGKVGSVDAATPVTLTATLAYGSEEITKTFIVTVVSADSAAYTLNIDGDDVVMDVSETLYGLFYEDINNAADGGIYAELVQNRSFEYFTFSGYASNYTTGVSTRTHNAKQYWTGDTTKMTTKTDGMNDNNAYYMTVADGATISNQGYTSNNLSAMSMEKGKTYAFSIYSKSDASSVKVWVEDDNAAKLTDEQTITFSGSDWAKYETTLTASATGLGTLYLEFSGEADIDMVSLMPVETWGYTDVEGSATASSNYASNSNYRLRSDLMQALADSNPGFLRFPGGCISEGSYTWDNVYDWKDSIGDVSERRENYNVWGYAMTMGLGYLEYFQMAEDLGAQPLPVMACGVLCQARSDAANVAGGALMDYYIQNFKDLLDFALGDETTEYGKLRTELGHPEKFDLHYIGVGNENWGNEFFANFEVFYAEINAYIESQGYDVTIISTVGAQANDSAYYAGWQFLSGNHASGTYTDTVATDEVGTSQSRTHVWYTSDSETDVALDTDYMDTVADEHYYRSNEYLLNNVDRYDYYTRVYNTDGTINDEKSSKVFVGEYASTDKNTMAGALAEAAIMTHYENNSDVVRLAATAPLFNKQRSDSLYRWTPDAIWFDDDSVWKTPNYYVQELFGSNTGDELLGTTFEYLDENGETVTLAPEGGVMIAAGNADVTVTSATIYKADGSVYATYDFTNMTEAELKNVGWTALPTSDSGYAISEEGLQLTAQTSGYNGIYLMPEDLDSYKIEVTATRTTGTVDGFYVGVGVTDVTSGSEDMVVYAINYGGSATGLKVYKDGVQGYTLGDYSVGTAAGNMVNSQYEAITTGTAYTITVDYGTTTTALTSSTEGVAVASGRSQLNAYYTDGTNESKVLNANLVAVNDMIYNSVTKDDEYVYVKLVNNDSFSKTTAINIDDLAMAGTGTMTVLAGTADNVSTANVNKDGAEAIAPTTSDITLTNGSTTISLPAYSVTILKLAISDGNVDVSMDGSLVKSYDLTTEEDADPTDEYAGRADWVGYTASDYGATYTEGNNTITEDENGVTLTTAGLNSYSISNPLKEKVTGSYTVNVKLSIPTEQYISGYEGLFGFNQHTSWDYFQVSNNGGLQANSGTANTAGGGSDVWYFGMGTEIVSNADNAEHMYTLTVDATEGAKLYVDGTLVVTYTEDNSDYVSTVGVGAAAALDWFNLGFNAGNGEDWNWFCSTMTATSASFYDKALTAEEIAALVDYVPSTGVTIEGEDSITITRGDSTALTAVVTPDDATNTVTWSSSDETVATVSKTGTVRGVAAGTATITATTTEGYSDTVTVTVEPVKVSAVNINTQAQTVDVGTTLKISATASPSNADNKTLTYASSDETVATIDESGLLTALAEGTTTVTVASTDGSDLSATVEITVKNYELESVEVTNAPDFDVVVGSSLRLKTAVTPEEASVTLSYASSDTAVATVDGGMLKALASGEATITVTAAKADDSSVSTSFTITVVEEGDLVADYQFKGDLVNSANQLQEGVYQTTTQADLAVGDDTISFNYSAGTGSANIVKMTNPLNGKTLTDTGFTVAVKLNASQINQYEGIWGFDDGSGYFGMGGSGQLWYNKYDGTYQDFAQTNGQITTSDGMELYTVVVDPENDEIRFYKGSALTTTISSTNVDSICEFVSGINYFNLGCAAQVYWGTAGFECDYVQVYQRQLTKAEVGYLDTTGSIEEPENVDTTALQEAIIKASAIDGSTYTKDSWDALTTALEAAQEIYEQTAPKATDVNDAESALTAAIAALEEYEEVTVPDADATYPFNGTLASSTEGLSDAELTGALITVTDGVGTTGSVTATEATYNSDNTAVVLSPANGYGLKLPITLTDDTFTFSFNVSYSAWSQYSPTLLIANETSDTGVLWSSIGQGWKDTSAITDTPMIWSHSTANGWNDLISSGANMELNKKVTVTATFNDGAGAIYVNGVQVGTGIVPTGYGAKTQVYLGVNAWDSIVSAEISDLNFFDTALSANQVEAMITGYDEEPSEATPITGDTLTAIQDLAAQVTNKAAALTGDNLTEAQQNLVDVAEDIKDIDYTAMTAEQAEALTAVLNNALAATNVAGDENGDGVVNVQDVMLLAQAASGQTATLYAEGDLNGDGVINVLDVMILSQVVAGNMTL